MPFRISLFLFVAATGWLTACGPVQAVVSGIDAGSINHDAASESGSAANYDASSQDSSGQDSNINSEADSATNCANICVTAGETRCAGSNVQTCTDLDSDGCLEWSAGQACPNGLQCVDGACACQNQCSSAGQTRCDGAGFQTCGDLDSDGCLEWSTSQSCPSGQSCSGDHCSSTCSDDCSNGQQQCSGTGVQTCGQYDADTCLDWSPAVNCESFEICQNGQCISNCGDECSVDGQLSCVDNAVRSCGNFDQDSCLEWSALTECKASETCTDGVCIAHCSSNCEAEGALRCDGNGVQTCHLANGCFIWSDPVDCAAQVCADGVCTTTCSDECTIQGERICDGTLAYRICGNFDDDTCLEWGSTTSCDAGEQCAEGQCALPAVCDDDSSEDNDSRETAAYVWEGGYDNLQICLGDEDWYRTYIFAGQSLKVDISFVHDDGDLDMKIIDAAGSSIGYSVSMTDDESIEKAITESGFYYIKVYGYLDAQNTYSLQTTITEPETCADDVREDNDDLAQAVRINAGTYYGLKVCSGDDDYYKIALQAGDSMTVDLEFRNENGDLDVYVLNMNDEIITSSISMTDNEHLVLARQEVGADFIIEVHGYIGARSPYTMRVEITNVP